MHDVRIDPLKNRLYITMGAWNYADNAAYINDIESACKDLVPGFTCLTVFKNNGIVRQSDRDLLFNTADLVYAYGAGKIVHVKKESDTLGFPQDGLMGFQTDFQVKNAKNIWEAEDILDGKSTNLNC